MGYQVVEDVFSITKDDLTKLFFENEILKVDGKAIQGLFEHEFYFDEEDGYTQNFMTYVIEEDLEFRAAVNLTSIDNVHFSGTIKFDRHNGDNMSE